MSRVGAHRLRALYLFVGVLCLGTPASAQDEASLAVSGGYSYLRFAPAIDFPWGWYADVARHVGRSVWLVGHGTGSYDNSEDTSHAAHVLAGGLRVARASGRVRPFGQLLFGVAHETLRVEFPEPTPGRVRVSRTDPAIEFGGGVDVESDWPVDVRVGFGYVRRFIRGGEGNPLKAYVGLVYAF